MEISRSYLVTLSQRAYELDDQISAASGGGNAGKRAITNKLVEASTQDPAAILGFLSTLPTVEERIGTWNKVVRAVEAAFEAEFDAYFASAIKTQPETPQAELETLINERKTINQMWNALTSVWSALNPTDDISDIPAPKKMTGLRGARGKRAISSYQFAINGTKLAADENSLTKIANKYCTDLTTKDKEGKDVEWKARDIRDFCVADAKARGVEFSWKTPPETFSFTLPNGVSLSASKMESAPDPDDNDDDDDDNATA